MLVAYPALSGPRQDTLLPVGIAAMLVLAGALALGIAAALPWVVALFAGEFVVSIAVRGESASIVAAVYGAALLLLAEFAFAAFQVRAPSRFAPRVLVRRGTAILGLVAASLVVGFVAAVLARAPLAGSLLLLGIGVGAVVIAVVTVVAVLWLPGAGRASSAPAPPLTPEDRAG